MKHLVLLLTLTLIPTLSFAAFSDVSQNHSNAQAIDYVKNQGIVSGYSDGTFRPDATINRAELAKILIGANFSDTTINNCAKGSTGLSDISADAWFAPFVCLAKQKDIIAGYSDGTFKPAQNVNFVEAAKMISLSFNKNDGGTGQWFTPFVNTLSNNNAIPTSVNSLTKSITRGEMAEMVYRLKAEDKTKTSLGFNGQSLTTKVAATPTPPAASTDEPGTYVDYSAAALNQALAEGKSTALFFHASWCPHCRTAETEIKNRITELPANSVIFKADYDDETALKRTHGVTTQTTVVFLDENGNSTFKKTRFSFQDLLSNL